MRTAILEFEEYPDEEIVVRIAPVSVDAFFEVTEKVNTLHWDPAEMAALSEAFAPFLVSWTFETTLGLFTHDMALGLGIVRNWAKAVRDVPLPLPVTPFDGTPSEAESPTGSDEPSSSNES